MTRVVAMLLVTLVVLTGGANPAVADLAAADPATADRDAVDDRGAVTDLEHVSHAHDGRAGEGPLSGADGSRLSADPSPSSDRIPGAASISAPTAVTAGNGSTPVGEAAAGIDERIVLAQDDERGYVRVTFEYDLSANVTALNVSVPFEYSLVEADGFGRLGESTVGWTEANDTTTPSVTFRIIADVGGRDGGFEFVDAGDWAIVRAPERTLEWSGNGDLAVETTRDVDGEGVVGSGIAYLGPYEEYVAEADAETVRLVVPAAADLVEPPKEIVETLARTSDELSVGAESGEVLLVAAPTGPDWLEWSALGLQRGDSDAWVRADASLSGPASTWIHEYVHTRQDYRQDADLETRWLLEAQADYYAALLSYEFGHSSFEEFRSYLRLGQHRTFDDVVLTERTTWRGTGGNYLKGALVVGAIDFEIRAATDGALTFQDVFRGMNERDGRLDHEAFVDLVEAIGGPDAARAADRYADTTATPVAWDRSAHEQTFVSAESPVVYRSAEFGVTGEYRETALSDEPVVTAGENLTATVQVENTAAFGATFEVTMTVDGEAVATEWGILDPGETRAVTLSHAFENSGEYEVAVVGGSGTAVPGAPVSVTVREPAGLTVTEIALEPTTVEPGESVTASATVTNPGEVPGEEVVKITVGGRTVHTERVALAPGETTTVEATFELNGSGSLTVAAGEASAEVTVGQTPSASDGFGVESPGFTGGAAAVAVGSLLALAARRRR